ncbi:hypothetical protein SteCoe_30795 [Stentor coeruleus]|uniref:Uncharacterized protein n=1 Tax=Stentor coeruleus TaxID=5963 RepID=A0A1R2B2S9_9CILI|nr:hypothetical protein SteCoe_30795 [Stentor coeruleus]
MNSPVTARRLIGNNIAGSLQNVTNNSISRPTPWESPIPVHNPNTSYGLSFNADHGKSVRIKEIGKLILENKSEIPFETKSQAVKLNAKNKPLLRVADSISESVVNYGRKISPIQLNSRLEIREDMFDNIVSQRENSPKTSSLNIEWIKAQERKRKVDNFLKGEFIPNMNQLQLYGRKAEKSKFEERELWVKSSLL